MLSGDLNFLGLTSLISQNASFLDKVGNDMARSLGRIRFFLDDPNGRQGVTFLGLDVPNFTIHPLTVASSSSSPHHHDL